MDSTRRQIRRMAQASPKAAKSVDYYDFSLLAVVIVLTVFGLIMLYSTTAYSSQISSGDDMEYLRKQGLIDIGCLVLALGISKLDYHYLERLAAPLYGLSIVLMGLVKTPFGVSSHGATRWIRLGPIQFQPSEFAKIAIIASISYMIVRMGKKVSTLRGQALLLLLGLIPSVFALFVTKNLSTAIIIFVITFGLAFLSHPRMKPFLIFMAIVVAAAVLGVVLISYLPSLSADFRLRRVQVWLRPEAYASSDGYQTLQALYAIGSGGFFGRGLGNSIQKISSIPEAHNDMIFSIICEELGVFGAILILALFAYLLYRLIFIAQNAPDLFGSLLVSGIFIHIALQVVLNIAVVVNLMPNTGVTLPFISYGGTSILFIMAEMGVALSVSSRIRFQNVPEALL